MAGTVTHFEIYAEDAAKLAAFYGDLFGWSIDKATGVDYYRSRTSANESAGIQGGILERPILAPRSWVHYVMVDSIDSTLEQVLNLGGKIVRAKAAVPKAAWYALVEDPQGNMFAIYERDSKAFPPPEPDI